MQILTGTPYMLESNVARLVHERLAAIESRVLRLRQAGTLTDATLKTYYGEKRFEQVAESNALEGSTLSCGETELAVLKGITITGHDPAYVRDAAALDRALARITELAQSRDMPTDIDQLHEVHRLLLGDRPGAGIFRREPVMIRGAQHVPPRTWHDIMTAMEAWETWSQANASMPAPIRSAVLHAWLVHIHPYIDGNGRAARAIGNLELIRAGYPPIIIKKKERSRYLDCLADSDQGGNIQSFFELIFDRIDGALTGLERSAAAQGYNPVTAQIKKRQEQNLLVWHNSIKILAAMIENNLSKTLQANGCCSFKLFEEPLELEDYILLCGGKPASHSWAFHLTIERPGTPRLEKLAYIGYRSQLLSAHLDGQHGPSLFWSHKNPAGYPKWLQDGKESPVAVELTTQSGDGNAWTILLTNDTVEQTDTATLAAKIAESLLRQTCQ